MTANPISIRAEATVEEAVTLPTDRGFSAAPVIDYNEVMAKKWSTPGPYVQPYRYPSPNIPLAAIRRFARQIAARFHPETIILFGSYA